MIKSAKAFAPGAISSFFEICDAKNGKPILDLERIGAIGGGFGLEKGVYTKATIQKSEKKSINVIINSKLCAEAKTTKKVAQKLLAKTSKKYAVTIEHQIEVPIGTGFGTSAGGALTTGLALKEALDLPLTYNQIGKIAHSAEIESQTGLGTVSSLTYSGGCVLVIKPGAPGVCQIDRIPISPDYLVVAGFIQSKKPNVLSPERKEQINLYGTKALQAILAKPSLKNFLDSCWEFAQKAGFATENVHKLVDLANANGAAGAAQNMLGEAVHALVLEKNVARVAEAFKQVLPKQQVIVSKVDFQGARLLK